MSSPYREPESAEILVLAERLVAVGATLEFWQATLDLASTLPATLSQLARDEGLVGRLEASTMLSRPMIEWALRTAAQGGTPAHLERVRRVDPLLASPGLALRSAERLAVVVLSGNVFTAGVRALVLPLVFGVPVLVKASSRDDVLPRALASALPERLREGVGIVTYPGGTEALDRALLASGDSIHVYGSDETCASLRALAPPHSSFVAHGHGIGVAVVLDSLDDCLPEAAEALAVDVAAYDQRGCLSPHEVFVHGTVTEARRFADALHVALTRLERELPRGIMPIEVAAAASQWRSTVASLGVLLVGPTHSVAVEIDSVLPRGPGWRHVVVRARGLDDIYDELRRLGPRVKAIGHTGGVGGVWAPRGCFARMSPIGQMQTPPFDAWLDGLPPWEGLLRLSRPDG